MKHTEKEMHITMRSYDDNMVPEYKRLEEHLKDTEWKASRITGDPKLGPGIKMYATAHVEATPLNAKKVVLAMAGELKQAGFKVLRAKVEEIIYDEIFGGNSV